MDSYFLSENCLNDYLNMIGKIPLLTASEEKELGVRILAGDRKAFEEMTVHNLRYVVSIAKGYMGFGLPLEDLIQEGILD